MSTPTEVAQRFYRALADGDGQALFDLLTDDFEGVVSAGMLHGVGCEHHGRVAMISDVWGRVDAAYDIAVEPSEFLATDTESSSSATTGARRAPVPPPSTPHSPTSSPSRTSR